MENGIIIDGHTYELIDDSSITRCDDCALLDKCCEFWAMAEEENPKLCTFLYGEKANNKRFNKQGTMTDKEIKAYNEPGEKRVKNGKALALLNTLRVSGHQLEDALKEDAKQWQGDFFKQFMGTPGLQEYFYKSEDNKRFLNDLFRHAFMYGGCYMMRVVETFNIEHQPTLSPEEQEELRKEIEKFNEECTN